LVAPTWLHLRRGCHCFCLFTHASFDHRFNGHGAGDFSVGFSTHAIGNYKQIQGLHNAETIFIVNALLPDVALSTANNAHKSPFPDGRANARSRVYTRDMLGPMTPVLTLTDTCGAGKPLNLTD
jgi:hypothetical protein